MRFIKTILAAVSLVLAATSAYPGGFSQGDTIIFAFPIDEPVLLSANFAELRFNHFHGGLDLRTGGREGMPVYSIAEGYVSRIRIDSKGYGNTIYVTHPNGYVSIYAHLLTFSNRVNRYIQGVQVEKQLNMIDVEVPETALPVSRCDVIALSGNSGSSRGPHLHFEIIDVKTGREVNPLMFYPQLKDRKKPIINNIRLYPMDADSYVNGSSTDKVFTAYRKSSYQDYSVTMPISVSGQIGFAVQGSDFFSNSYHTFGLYKVQLYVDSALVYEHKMDYIEPWEQRCINSFIDYEHFMKTKHHFQKSFVEQNNRLKIYSRVNESRGIITFDQPGIHKCSYVVSDYHGNSAKISFTVASKPSTKPKVEVTHGDNFLSCKERHVVEKDGIKILLGRGALFNDIDLKLRKDSITRVPNARSAIFSVQDNVTPIRDSVIISIKTKKEIDERYRNKVLIATCASPKYTVPVGGKYDTGWVSAPIKFFSKFVVIIDSVAPVIQPIRVYNRAILSSKAGMFFRIWDGLSGIGTFNCWIDGTWMIMYYDQKQKLISLWFDPARMEYGKWHTCKLQVEDTRGNVRTSEFTFFK